MIVLDASVVVEIVLATPAGAKVRAAIAETEEPLIAPHLLDIEVLSALRRLTLRSSIPQDQGDRLLLRFTSIPVDRYGQIPLLPRIWQLRTNFTACDATYIALAEETGSTLYTTDQRLARGHRANVRVFANA